MRDPDAVPRTMRSHLLRSTSLIVAAVVVGFGVAGGLLYQRAVRDEARSRLIDQVDGLVLSISDRLLASGSLTAAELAAIVPAGDELVLVVDGTETRSGAVATTNVHSVTADGPAGSSLTLIADAGPIDARVRTGWEVIAVVGTIAVAAAVGLAAWQARRLTQPLVQLQAAAEQLAAATATVTAPRSGITEIDAIGVALESSAEEIARMVRSERAFSANASHQLRSPLTAMALRLEMIATSADAMARTEAAIVLDELHGLDRRIDELLRFARTGRMAERVDFDVAGVVTRQVERTRPAFARSGRSIQLHTAPARALATPAVLGEVIDVVLDNALRHGAGTVTVSIGATAGRAWVRVGDEGAMRAGPQAASHGVGLVLARSLLRADGGAIELVSERPTTFEISLPRGSG